MSIEAVGQSSESCTCTSEGGSYGADSQGDGQCRHTSRRLYEVLDVDKVAMTLQDLEMQGWRFPGMTYIGRTMDLRALLGETSFSSFTPILEGISAMVTPFYHHMLLFPVGLNGTLASPVAEALGLNRSSQADQVFSHLLIHIQREGVQGRFGSFSPQESPNSYTFVGSVDPSWIKATLGEVGRKPFSMISWNCQHFAVHLFKEIARACRASGMLNCPPEDVNVAFPSVISPAWCLSGQAFGLAGLAVGSAAMMVGMSYKLLKWGAMHAGCPK